MIDNFRMKHLKFNKETEVMFLNNLVHCKLSSTMILDHRRLAADATVDEF